MRVHRKKREIKLRPRLFAMLNAELRYYFCATEKNLANKLFPLFPLFPYQTMVHTEINS